MASIAIVGAGHNALVAAWTLARGGHHVIVLERRAIVGGCVITGELAPGFRAPLLSHVAGPLVPELARELGLERHGLKAVGPSAQVLALDADGTALIVEDDRTVRPIGRTFPPRDAERFTAFVDTVRKLSALLTPLLHAPPPSIQSPSLGEILSLAGSGRRFRALGKRDAFRLLRWAPMSIADVVDEAFDDELLRGAVAARAIFGCKAGPRSAGTTLELLIQSALSGRVLGDSASLVGGSGSLTQALAKAAREAGAIVRTEADVRQVLVEGGAARGVRLHGGEELSADVVASSADPKHTFLELVDAASLGPEFVGHVRHIRTEGVVAKVNLALSALPRFRALEPLSESDRLQALSGRIQVAPSLEYLERAFDCAKYGELSPHPYLDIRLPAVSDPAIAPPGEHVASIAVQFAPRHLRGATWTDVRTRLLQVVLDTLDEQAPGIRRLVRAHDVITPEDLEQTYGLSGGHIFHGEHALDQRLLMRPVYGWANYRTPVAGLYLCGAGAHPGGGVSGACGMIAAREILKDLRKRR